MVQVNRDSFPIYIHCRVQSLGNTKDHYSVATCVHSHTHLPYDLLELGGDDLPLLVFGSGWTLAVPLHQLIHSLQVEEGLQTIDVVIHKSEVLVVDCTAHLGGGAECHVLVM